MNKKEKLTTDGFSVVELLIVIVVIVVIGGAGYLVMKHHNKNKSDTNKSTATTSSTVSLKSFCDSTSNLCFKYPNTWTSSNVDSPPTGLIQTVLNPTSKIGVQFADYPEQYGIPASNNTANPLSTTQAPADITINLGSSYPFFVSSVQNTSDSSYKVVSGYYSSNTENIPAINLMNASPASSLKVGQTNLLGLDSFDLTNPNTSGKILILTGSLVSSTPYSEAEAAAWLKSGNGQTILNIVRSVNQEIATSATPVSN
jgi:hypothetical protein